MGLDMYLTRMPRYENATAKDVNAIEEYMDWKQSREDPTSDARKCSMKKWCGIDYKDINKHYLNYYKQFYHETFPDWDTEHKHPWWRIDEQVGYWRKANAIHNWFVKNVQDGIDDCDYHHEVTEQDIRNLLNKCLEVLSIAKVQVGNVKNGSTYSNGKWHDIIEEGVVVINPDDVDKILPACDGFFFGGTDYDEYYLDYIYNTVDICRNVLKTTDFDNQMLYYCSSW